VRQELRAKVLTAVELPNSGEATLARAQAVEDGWEVAFAGRHKVWASAIADSWLALRRTWYATRRLLEILTPAERDELEAWAQRTLYQEPRPEQWPPVPRMNLAHAARRPERAG
jgi:hypothetical protein